MDDSLVHKVLVVPDRLTLAEVLEQFRQVHEDFAVIVNEYSLVVGVVTLNDVMSTVMGGLVSPGDEEQILRRDENSWLIDGVTPVEDVMQALELDELPHAEDYETLGGFLMVMLRRIPRRTDTVQWGGYRFEVMDVDSYRIDQVLVTRMSASSPAAPPTPATRQRPWPRYPACRRRRRPDGQRRTAEQQPRSRSARCAALAEREGSISQRRCAANTAFGYWGCPRLPL